MESLIFWQSDPQNAKRQSNQILYREQILYTGKCLPDFDENKIVKSRVESWYLENGPNHFLQAFYKLPFNCNFVCNKLLQHSNEFWLNLYISYQGSKNCFLLDLPNFIFHPSFCFHKNRFYESEYNLFQVIYSDNFKFYHYLGLLDNENKKIEQPNFMFMGSILH